MSNQKTISVRLDPSALVSLCQENEFTGVPKNRIVNRAIRLYWYLAQLQRDYKAGTTTDKQFAQECHRLLNFITDDWS